MEGDKGASIEGSYPTKGATAESGGSGEAASQDAKTSVCSVCGSEATHLNDPCGCLRYASALFVISHCVLLSLVSF